MATKTYIFFNLQGQLTTAGSSVSVSNDLVFDQAISATDVSVVLRKANGEVELMEASFSGGTMTISKRGITSSDTQTEDSNLKKQFEVGTLGYITNFSYDLLDKQAGGTITGDITMEGILDFNGASNTGRFQPPRYTTSERDALTSPADGEVIYNETTGMLNQYIGSARIEVGDTGTPNASESVAGKVEEATQAELNAGTATGATGARLFSNPSKLPTAVADYINNNSTVQTAFDTRTETVIETSGIESIVDKDTYITGEDVTAGEALFTEDMITFADADQEFNIGDVSANTRQSVIAFGSGVSDNQINMSLRKEVSPSDDLGIRIETDNSGEPSGTLVDANATATVTAASLTTSLADTTVTFAGSFSIPKGTKVHVVLFVGTYGSETINGTNYYVMGYDEKNTTTRTMQSYDGSNWTQGLYTLNSITYNKALDVSSQDTTPQGIAFNNDGTKMFIVGTQNDNVYEYDLSTGYDISTASYVDSFDVSSQDNSPIGIAFNNDGTKMFIVGNQNDNVYEYDLSTGYDISTASYVDSFDISSQDTRPEGIAFNNDGTKMFISGRINDSVYEYDLSTGYDISTASYVDSFDVSSQDDTPVGMCFDENGYVMYVVGASGQDINRYTLTTAYDISTASFDDNFSVSSQDTDPRGIYVNAQKNVFIIGGEQNDSLYSYGPEFNVNFVYVDSDLFTPKLLSKTSASYEYKLPTDITRIATETVTEGNECICTTFGQNSSQSGMTPLAEQYISDIFGGISETPGTNTYGVGAAITATILNVIDDNAGYHLGTLPSLTASVSSATTDNSDVYQAPDNMIAVFISRSLPGTNDDSTTLVQYSEDGSTGWTTIGRGYYNTGSDAPAVSITVPFIKGGFYRVQAYSNGASGVANISIVSLTKLPK